MIHIVLAESELELVPESLWSKTEVKDYSKSRGKKPSECVLDATYVPNAIVSLPEGSVRGRPEVVHLCLLNALESDAYKDGRAQFWIHTRNDEVIRIEPKFRIPRVYSRFVELVEDLLTKGQVPPEGHASMTLQKKSLEDLLDEVKPSKTLILSKEGKRVSRPALLKEVAGSRNPVILVGGFSDRDFSDKTRKLSKNVYKISDNQLTAWAVLGTLVYGLA